MRARRTLARALALALAAFMLLSQSAAQADDGPESNESGALDPSFADGVAGATVPSPLTTIAQYVASSAEHEVLATLLNSVDNLTAQLAEPAARFTAFAPTDSAFAAIARRLVPPELSDSHVQASNVSAVVTALQAGIAALSKLQDARPFDVRKILVYHLIGDVYSLEQLQALGSVPTQSGDNLTFVPDQEIVIDGDESSPNASLTRRDVLNQNGWLNVIDHVLLPFNLDRALADLGRLRPSPTTTATATASASMSATASPSLGSSPSSSPTVTPSTSVGASASVAPSPTPSLSFGASPSPTRTAENPSNTTASPESDDDNVCFPADATVLTTRGRALHMYELEAGTPVRHAEHPAALSRVFLFTHRAPRKQHTFVALSVANGLVVTLSPAHYLYANGRLSVAGSLRVGDELRTVRGRSAVVKVERLKKVGLFAPHSMHGDLVVDGVVVSSYSKAVAPWLAHALLLPVRAAAVATRLREPLGGVFYNGADALLRFIPRGRDVY